MEKGKIQQVLAVATCILIFAAVAIRQQGQIWGYDIVGNSQFVDTMSNDTITVMPDGEIVVNTTPLCKRVVGYGGRVPLRIHVRNSVVERVEPLKNYESPEFFEKAVTLLDKWNGKKVEEAMMMQVDAVSGATFSSRAIIANVQAGLDYLQEEQESKSNGFDTKMEWKYVVVLLVLVLSIFVPLYKPARKWRVVQLVLNVLVLGFWGGAFLSYSTITNVMANGVHSVVALIPVTMFIVAYIFPLLGKPNHYCNQVCPFGAAQELCSMIPAQRLKISSVWVARLNNFRKILWAVLLVLLLCDVFAAWTDYELTSAFAVNAVSWLILLLAFAFLVLSIFVPRGYCRFVCPTGSMFKLVQEVDPKHKLSLKSAEGCEAKQE